MSTLRTRAAKASELSHAELDANFKKAISRKTTTYACLVGDNRDTIECLHASTPFTVTLGDANTMDSAETGDYEITIANIGAAAVTVARAGSDTINGVATSLTLNQYDSVTLKVISTSDGYQTIGGLTAAQIRALVESATDSNVFTDADHTKLNGIETSATIDQTDAEIRAAVEAATDSNVFTDADHTKLDSLGAQDTKLNSKVIDIGDWNMDSTLSVNILHGLTYSKIRSVTALIRDDADTTHYMFPTAHPSATDIERITVTLVNVTLQRAATGSFDAVSFDSTSYNRGWIIIQYID